MKRTTLRASATTALAAVAFAIGAPAASAVEYHRSEARAAATVQTGQPALSADEARALLAAPELRGELAPAARADMQAVADGTATQRQQRASAASAGKALWNLIKKAGPSIAKAAKKAAGKYSTFRNWINGLAWYNPIKIAWIAAGSEAQYQMWKWIHDHA